MVFSRTKQNQSSKVEYQCQGEHPIPRASLRALLGTAKRTRGLKPGNLGWSLCSTTLSHPGALTKSQPPHTLVFIYEMEGWCALHSASENVLIGDICKFLRRHQTLLHVLQGYTYHDPQPEITRGFTDRSLIIENSPGAGVQSINSRFKRMRVSKCKSQWSTEVKSDGQGCLGSDPTRWHWATSFTATCLSLSTNWGWQ